MLFRGVVVVENPMTGESRVKRFQFDPELMTQTKWNNRYPDFNAMVQELVTAATLSEPPTV
jgi:hypothetical protein